MEQAVYEVLMPARRTTGAVFASPHSGRNYPWSFVRRSLLDERTIRSSEDAFVDELFAEAPALGAPLLAARTPRAYVDFNRGPEELDPALIRGVAGAGHNPRVASGLGVIPRVVAGGREIYRGKIDRIEAEGRLHEHWHPYHARLARLLEDARSSHGIALLIDCHSMPHDAVVSLTPGRGPLPQVVLGDRFGASAAAGIVDRIEASLRAAGLVVARNAPFAGAYTARHYGRPSAGWHVVQIELDRSLYMNEAELRPSRDFAQVKGLITALIAQIAEIGRPEGLPLAAE